MLMFFGGLAVILVSIGVAMVIDGNALGVLVGPSSLVLVFFSTLGASVMAYGVDEIRRLPKVVRTALRGEPPDLDDTVTTLASLADVARKEGMLALESRLDDVSDPGVRQTLQLVVDGLDGEQIEHLVRTDLDAVRERHEVGISMFQSLGGYAPTFGMVGTVIGLINMLQNLTDPEQLGVGMALALLTTLYGVMLANMVFLPVASRLERLSDAEISVREAALDGVIALQNGISPRLLVERLEIFLPPERRVGYQARSGKQRVTSEAA